MVQKHQSKASDSHNKTIILHLETVSPILVWSGEELVFDENNKKVIVWDEADLKLFKNNFWNIPVKIGKCFGKNCKNCKDLKLFSYYVNPEWKRVRFLPWSSVKGLLRSVVGKYILDKILEVSFKRVKGKITWKSYVNFWNKNFNFEIYFKTLLQELYKRKNKKFNNKEPIQLNDFKDAFNYFLDLIFRNIIVKDTILPDDWFSIYLAKNLHREPGFRKWDWNKWSIHTWFEWFRWNVDIEIKINNFQIKQNLGEIYSKLWIDFGNTKDWNEMFDYYAKKLKEAIEKRIDQGIALNKVKELKNKIPNIKEDNKYLVRLGFWKHEESYKFIDDFNNCSIWWVYESAENDVFKLSSFINIKLEKKV